MVSDIVVRFLIYYTIATMNKLLSLRNKHVIVLSVNN